MSRRYAKNGCRRPEKRAVRVDAMSEDFAKLIERLQEYPDAKSAHFSAETKALMYFKSALGEWAFNYCLEILKNPTEIGIDDIFKGNEIWKIVEACLGKKEADKRLASAGGGK